jgi:hypothetical protein
LRTAEQLLEQPIAVPLRIGHAIAQRVEGLRELVELFRGETGDELVGERVGEQGGALRVGIDHGELERVAVLVDDSADARRQLTARLVGSERLDDTLGNVAGGGEDCDHRRVRVVARRRSLRGGAVVEDECVRRPEVGPLARRRAIEERGRSAERRAGHGDRDDEAPMAAEHSEVSEKIHGGLAHRHVDGGGRVDGQPSVTRLGGRTTTAGGNRHDCGAVRRVAAATRRRSRA